MFQVSTIGSKWPEFIGVWGFPNILPPKSRPQALHWHPRYYAVEKFGKFSHMLKPGLATVGLDCCGACVSFRSITSRTEQNMVSVSTKTKDARTVVKNGWNWQEWWIDMDWLSIYILSIHIIHDNTILIWRKWWLTNGWPVGMATPRENYDDLPGAWDAGRPGRWTPQSSKLEARDGSWWVKVIDFAPRWIFKIESHENHMNISPDFFVPTWTPGWLEPYAGALKSEGQRLCACEGGSAAVCDAGIYWACPLTLEIFEVWWLYGYLDIIDIWIFGYHESINSDFCVLQLWWLI